MLPDSIFNFLDTYKWWIMLAIILAGWIFIYWGSR